LRREYHEIYSDIVKDNPPRLAIFDNVDDWTEKSWMDAMNGIVEWMTNSEFPRVQGVVVAMLKPVNVESWRKVMDKWLQEQEYRFSYFNTKFINEVNNIDPENMVSSIYIVSHVTTMEILV
jgi:hypothetical protein